MKQSVRKDMKLIEADIRHKKPSSADLALVASYLRFLGAATVDNILIQPESEQANLRGQLIAIQNLLDVVEHSDNTHIVRV